VCFLYGSVCHGAHKLDLSTLFTTFFLNISSIHILIKEFIGRLISLIMCMGAVLFKAYGALLASSNEKCIRLLFYLIKLTKKYDILVEHFNRVVSFETLLQKLFTFY